MTVRESGTDTPAPNPATLLIGSPQPCTAAGTRQQIVLETMAYSFLGRKGPYLLFSATDPNGAVPFMVVNLAGKVLYTDSTAAERGIHALTVEHDALHIVFTRGINADCSLMQGAAACWSKLLASGKLPKVMAATGPTSQACEPAYSQARAPANAPSIVTYDVVLTVDPAGRTQVASRGQISCTVQP